MWNVKLLKKGVKLKNPILIEGLPGIGNVAKISVDFLVEELKAKPLYELSSKTMPASVFVQENNLVELPHIYLYYKKMLKNDLLLLGGDVQPLENVPAYEFAEVVLQLFKKMNGKLIITLGGIGLSTIPKEPKVYCTGNSKKVVSEFVKNTSVSTKLFGVVGPIIGAAGLLLGIAKENKIPAVSLLAETFAHPMFIGIKSSREIIKILNKKLNLKINIKKIDKQVESFEKAITSTKQPKLKPVKSKSSEELNYIG